ncbi:unnamed protein product [Trifolium pratense]|uniref:Uncharacterized protein n=1 Tax=Trifolium pratense TaxID=57577 RepID=A0ACB0LMA7_TRIPR|nr:unnamed protein product [Trifolium pratense]
MERNCAENLDFGVLWATGLHLERHKQMIISVRNSSELLSTQVNRLTGARTRRVPMIEAEFELLD